MDKTIFTEVMQHIVVSLHQAGYYPKNQLIKYLETGQDYYITRAGNARSIIRSLDKHQIMQYVLKMV